jgi:hypothetical protein
MVKQKLNIPAENRIAAVHFTMTSLKYLYMLDYVTYYVLFIEQIDFFCKLDSMNYRIRWKPKYISGIS